jgi:hypothetical protein
VTKHGATGTLNQLPESIGASEGVGLQGQGCGTELGVPDNCTVVVDALTPKVDAGDGFVVFDDVCSIDRHQSFLDPWTHHGVEFEVIGDEQKIVAVSVRKLWRNPGALDETVDGFVPQSHHVTAYGFTAEAFNRHSALQA